MSDAVARWVEALGLVPHPEGGFYKETYRAGLVLPSGRACATAIHFLVTRGSFSALHRIQSDEGWHFHAGGALEIVTIAPDGSRADLHLGLDVTAGERPQHVVPAGTWFGARLRRPADDYALVSCTVSPGFDFADFELGTRAALTQSFPQHAALVAAMTRG